MENKMIRQKDRHSRLFKTIVMGMVCLFLANQLTWANTNALNPTGIQNPKTEAAAADMLHQQLADKNRIKKSPYFLKATPSVQKKKSITVLLIAPPLGLESLSDDLTKSTSPAALYTFPQGLGSIASCLSDKEFLSKAIQNGEFTNPEEYPDINFRILDLQSALGRQGFDLRQYLLDLKPDVVGVGAMSTEITIAGEIADITAETLPDTLRIIGGPHCTAEPKDTLKRTKYQVAIMGDGEETLANVLVPLICEGRVDLSTIHNLAYEAEDGSVFENEKRDPLVDINDYAFVSHSWADTVYDGAGSITEGSPPRFKTASIFAARMCPLKCRNCAVPHLSPYRRRSPKNVVEELKFMQSQGIAGVAVRDDTFVIDKKWVNELIDEYEKAGLRGKLSLYALNVYPGLLDRKTLKRLMEVCGCERIVMGVESGDEEVLKTLNRAGTLEKARETTKLCHEEKIPILHYYMTGLPDQTWQSAYRSWQFIKETDPDIIGVHMFRPVPGSDLAIQYANMPEEERPVKHTEYDKYGFPRFNEGFTETTKLSNAEVNYMTELFKRLSTEKKRSIPWLSTGRSSAELNLMAATMDNLILSLNNEERLEVWKDSHDMTSRYIDMSLTLGQPLFENEGRSGDIDGFLSKARFANGYDVMRRLREKARAVPEWMLILCTMWEATGKTFNTVRFDDSLNESDMETLRTTLDNTLLEKVIESVKDGQQGNSFEALGLRFSVTEEGQELLISRPIRTQLAEKKPLEGPNKPHDGGNPGGADAPFSQKVQQFSQIWLEFIQHATAFVFSANIDLSRNESIARCIATIFWDEIEQFIRDEGFSTLEEFREALRGPDTLIQIRFAKFMYSMAGTESSFMRYKEQYEGFGELVREYIKEHKSYPPVGLFAPGTYQEPITLAIIMETIGREEGLGELPQDCFVVSGTMSNDADSALLNKISSGELIYDPEDINNLPKEMVDRYFEKTERGFRPIERMAELVLPKSFTPLHMFAHAKLDGKNGYFKFVFLNNVIQYVHDAGPGATRGMLNVVNGMMREDGVLFAAAPSLHLAYVEELFAEHPRLQGIAAFVKRSDNKNVAGTGDAGGIYRGGLSLEAVNDALAAGDKGFLTLVRYGVLVRNAITEDEDTYRSFYDILKELEVDSEIAKAVRALIDKEAKEILIEDQNDPDNTADNFGYDVATYSSLMSYANYNPQAAFVISAKDLFRDVGAREVLDWLTGQKIHSGPLQGRPRFIVVVDAEDEAEAKAVEELNLPGVPKTRIKLTEGDESAIEKTKRILKGLHMDGVDYERMCVIRESQKKSLDAAKKFKDELEKLDLNVWVAAMPEGLTYEMDDERIVSIHRIFHQVLEKIGQKEKGQPIAFPLGGVVIENPTTGLQELNHQFKEAIRLLKKA